MTSIPSHKRIRQNDAGAAGESRELNFEATHSGNVLQSDTQLSSQPEIGMRSSGDISHAFSVSYFKPAPAADSKR